METLKKMIINVTDQFKTQVCCAVDVYLYYIYVYVYTLLSV